MILAAGFAAFVLTFLACEPTEVPIPDGPDTEEPVDTTQVVDTTEVEKPVDDGINGDVDDNSAFEGLSHTTYVESEEVIPNPERGFYSVRSIRSATASPMTTKAIETARQLNRTIYYMGYYLTDYMDSDISEDYLQLLRTNMQVLREGGAKCVLRFAYSDSESEKPWDATPDIVQRHIKNLKPVLQEYGDVIMCFQAGFVGVWGEWYYTENFVSNPSTPEQHSLRKAVVDAMLDAIPKDRSVSLRTPMFKRMMYAESYADTLTIATAHNQSDRARISCFNDCFGASSNDQGTFAHGEARQFWKTESRYLFMGGETCAKSPYCTCEKSLKDMEDYHWTYLNSEYNGTVLGRWRLDGCMKEIERRLGYRLYVSDVFHTTTPKADTDFRVALRIKNTGFSAPINPRGVEFILVDGEGNKTVYKQADIDPRFWFAGGKYIVDKTFKIPAEATGKCTLYLNLPDPKETLHDHPYFAIRLANDGLWDETTGYNQIAEFTL